MGLNRQLANLPDAITTDTSNNVGIGGSPSGTYKFEVTGYGRFNNASGMALQANGGAFTQATASSYSLGVGNTGGFDLTLGTSTTAGVIQTWSSKPLSLNPQGNNVLIGSTTDSSYKLDVTGTVRFSTTLLVSGAATFSDGVTSASFFNVLKNGSDSGFSGPYIAVSNAANNVTWGWQLGASNQLALFSYASSTIKNPLNINITGNVGIAVTPSSWSSSFKALQVGTASLSQNNNTTAYIASNWVSESGGDKYITTNAAAIYAQNTGAHIWYTAPSGTAGDAMTFTERMRITSGGVTAIAASSNTSDLGSTGLVIGGSSILTSGNVLMLNFIPIGHTSNRARAGIGCLVGTDWGKGNLTFYTQDASSGAAMTTANERMRITSDGNVGIGTTTTGSKLAVAGVIALGNNIDGVTNLSYGGRISAKGTSVPGSSSTIIHRGLGSVGYFILVSGIGGPSNTGRFMDLVYGTGSTTAPTTLASNQGGGSAPTRTYSLSAEKLHLSLSGGDTWYITTTGLGAMEE